MFATAVVLMFGLFGSAVGFAATSSAAQTPHTTAGSANSAQVSHTTSSATLPASARTMVFSNATAGKVNPNAVFFCQGAFVSAFQFNFVCNVQSGLIDIIGHCADGSISQTGFFGNPPGVYSGFVFCGSGLVSVSVATIG